MANNKQKRPISVITPATQYANLAGVLNTGIKNKNLSGVLGDLEDVLINEVGKDDILIYNGTQWVNKNIKDVLKKYIWIIDGGSAEDWEENEDENPEIPEKDSYAEEFLAVLYNFINDDKMQDIINNGKIKGLSSMYMEQNKVVIEMNGRVKGLMDYFYNDENISRMLGYIISSIYDNVARNSIRDTFEELGDDLLDQVIEWQIDKVEEGEKIDTVFIYFSDSSGVYLELDFKYKV